MFSLICVWINGWVNNGEAGDLRRYRAHYDVIVMESNDLCVHWHGLQVDPELQNKMLFPTQVGVGVKNSDLCNTK